MSNARGNVKKSGPPKHKNKTAFKNTLHDKSRTTQMLNSLSITGVCQRCKDCLEWKIKYKKYKVMTQAKTCVKCSQKTVKRAYYTYCQPCSKTENVCAKCGKKNEIVLEPGLSTADEMSKQSQMETELKMLPERKRRTILRQQAKGETQPGRPDNEKGQDSDLDDLQDDFSDLEC